ncbi:MAG: hypothetical protein L3J21_12930 [Devosiaceae bacterium]|nr:hypothetical protein [Devosiaceae bacterium]
MKNQNITSNDSQSNRNVPIPSIPAKPVDDGLTIHGELDNDILNRKISISNGRRVNAKSFLTKTDLLGTFFAALSKHAVGKKEGACFLQGALFEKKRSSTQVKSLDLLVCQRRSKIPPFTGVKIRHLRVTKGCPWPRAAQCLPRG